MPYINFKMPHKVLQRFHAGIRVKYDILVLKTPNNSEEKSLRLRKTSPEPQKILHPGAAIKCNCSPQSQTNLLGSNWVFDNYEA